MRATLLSALLLSACTSPDKPAGDCERCVDTGATTDSQDGDDSAPDDSAPDDSAPDDSAPDDSGAVEVCDHVTLHGSDGSTTDLTEALTSGDYLTFSTPGTLEICPGTWFARLTVETQLEIIGLGEAAEDTVLSGGESGTVISVVGEGSAISVEGLTIDRGLASGAANTALGGGVYCEQASMAFTDARFTNNHAHDGGAVYADRCGLSIDDSALEGNSADDDGGAIALQYSTATLTNVIIHDNVAQTGALFYNESNIYAAGVTLQDNEALLAGGAVYAYEGSLELVDSEVLYNTAATSGGGLFTRGQLSLTRVRFEGNQAGNDGGAIFIYESSLAEGSDCDFVDNSPHDLIVFGQDSVSYDLGLGANFGCYGLGDCVTW